MVLLSKGNVSPNSEKFKVVVGKPKLNLKRRRYQSWQAFLSKVVLQHEASNAQNVEFHIW